MSDALRTAGPGSTRGPAAAPGWPVGPAQALRALALVVLYVAASAAAVLGLHASGIVELTRSSLPVVLVAGLTVAPLLALHLHLLRRHRPSAADLGFTRPGRRLSHLLWQVPLALVCAVAAQGTALLLSGGTHEAASAAAEPDAVDQLLRGPAPLVLLGLAASVLLAPLWEEVLFRGTLLPSLLRRVRPLGAVVLSAGVFAALHLHPLLMPHVFVLGLFLGWLRVFHRNLWAPLVLHVANNGLVALVVLGAR